MDKRHLVHFLSVVDEGSISAAARRLGLSQPSVSQTVQELERELDCTLFTRGRGMSPTSSGRALVGPARAALRAMDAAHWAIKEISALRSGELDVGCAVNLAVDPLVDLVRRHRARHPGVTIRIRNVQPGARGFDALARGEIELLLAEHPPAATGFAEIPLGERPLVAVFPPGTRLAERPLRLDEFVSHDLITAPSPGAIGRSHLNRLLAEQGLGSVVPVLETAHRHMLIPLILAGVGGTLLHGTEAEIAERLGAVVRPLDADIPTAHAFYFSSEDLSPSASSFVALIREAVPNL
ncbi:LysR family transcriptional regulator [Rhodococcus hoagii]|nr:LysR family transcriptional regulator [Prescottella equi]NKS65514.1 LysR family transcriptional regulator [Prescottella equi]NKS77712.1 LysR family transcriptional regulator [Prescottella equi]